MAVCLHCGSYYEPLANTGGRGCYIHIGQLDPESQIWSCCGVGLQQVDVQEYAARRGEPVLDYRHRHYLGCRRADHDIHPGSGKVGDSAAFVVFHHPVPPGHVLVTRADDLFPALHAAGIEISRPPTSDELDANTHALFALAITSPTLWERLGRPEPLAVDIRASSFYKTYLQGEFNMSEHLVTPLHLACRMAGLGELRGEFNGPLYTLEELFTAVGQALTDSARVGKVTPAVYVWMSYVVQLLTVGAPSALESWVAELQRQPRYSTANAFPPTYLVRRYDKEIYLGAQLRIGLVDELIHCYQSTRS